MSNLTIQTSTREDIITLGKVVGLFAVTHDPYIPLTITVGGDTNSGKSLLALAIDTVFKPDFYAQGIKPDLSADEIMKPCCWDGTVSPVVFQNFKGQICTAEKSFDNTLRRFRDRHLPARVIVASNLERTLMGQFDYASRGLCSDILDSHFSFDMRPNRPFSREIKVATKHQGLIDAISTAHLECRVH